MPQLRLISHGECFVALALTLALAGCQSHGFHAGNLPPDLRVQSAPQSSMIKLSGATLPSYDHQIIGPGDQLNVAVHSGRDGEIPQPATVEVSEQGMVDLPIIGPVSVAGLRPLQARQNVAHAAIERGIYRRPNVNVEIESKAVVRVTVLGAVEEPGVHELPRTGSDLVHALALAGGTTEEAGVEVEITRQSGHRMAAAPSSESGSDKVQLASHQQPQPGQYQPASTVKLDLSKATSATNFQLSEGDAVLVLPHEKELIYVSGLVVEPGQFELPRDQELRLLDAIAMAGDVKSPVADKVLVLRRLTPESEPTPIVASISRAKRNSLENLRLSAGDAITVERTPATVVVDTFGKLFRVSMGLSSGASFF